MIEMKKLANQVNETEVASIEIYSITVSHFSCIAHKGIDLWELLRV